MKSLTYSFAATALAASLTIVGRPADAVAQVPASVVTVATIGEPPTLDPVAVTSDLVSIISQHVFETLYTFDAQWALTPLVAAALPTVSADGKTYTIPLRTDVVFHDGTKMTTDDVVASLERWTRLSPRGKSAAAFIEKISGDGAKVVIALKQPYAPLSSLLAMNNGAAVVVPKSIIDGVNPLKSFIGTGPYKFLEHKPDQYVRLVRFDRYVPLAAAASGYGGARVAKIDELRFVPVPNAATRAEGIVAGQFQFADSLPAEMKPRIDGAAGLKSVVVKPFGFPLMIMNNKTGVLADQKLRKAVATAVSPEEMLTAGFGDPAFFAVEGSIYAPGTVYYDKASVSGYAVADTAKAAAAVKAAGYKGEPIRIMTSMQYDFLYKMSLVAQAELEAAGFKVDLQVLDWATLVQRRADDKAWDAFFTYHTFVPEPSLITITNPSYPGWWDNPAKNAAFAAFNGEMDPKARVAKWAEMQKQFYADVPTIKVGEFYNLAARSAKLVNYQPMPWPFFWNVELAK
jgi:peptide/nickel transport system substrate-binding protein